MNMEYLASLSLDGYQMSEIEDEEEVVEELPEGDDLLWYYPKGDYSSWREEFRRVYFCERCDVRWQESPENKVRCWCCGRFHKRRYQ